MKLRNPKPWLVRICWYLQSKGIIKSMFNENWGFVLIILAVLVLVIFTFTFVIPNKTGINRGISENLRGSGLDTANTMSPIISAICQELCPFPSTDEDGWVLSGELIYKKEHARSCIYEPGNVYYCRCYRWNWIDTGDSSDLYYKAIEDKSLEELFGKKVYSCIDESELLIPYYDKELAEMEIGETKLIVSHKW
jgi:hypothetical protein